MSEHNQPHQKVGSQYNADAINIHTPAQPTTTVVGVITVKCPHCANQGIIQVWTCGCQTVTMPTRIHTGVSTPDGHCRMHDVYQKACGKPGKNPAEH
jgi:hypothetical protein